MHDGNNNPSRDIGLRGMELLDDILERIRANEEAWDQTNWANFDADRRVVTEEEMAEIKKLVAPESCGTAYCVAGYAAHLTGAKIDWYPIFDEAWNSATRSYETQFVGWRAENVNNGAERIADYAGRVLELDLSDSVRLFRGENKLDELEMLRDLLRAGKSIADYDA